MANVLAMLAIPNDDAVAANGVVNTWHFGTVDASPEDQSAAIAAALNTFYTHDYSGYGSVSALFSSRLAHTGAVLKMYDLADTKPRAPFYEASFALTAPSNTNSLPAEVALCLSFRGEKLSGANMARKRGRIYFGPWSTTALASGTDGLPDMTRVGAALFQAGLALRDASEAAADWTWGVYSTAGSTFSRVTTVWIDNDWDTQRRRGRKATVRTSDSIAGTL